MSFKDVLKKVGEKTKELIDMAAKNIQYNQKLDEAKMELLLRFKMEDLKKICTIKGISTYIDESDFFEERRRQARTKSELVELVIDELSFDEIVRYAKRYKVKYKDVVEELEEVKRELYGEDLKSKKIREEIQKLESGEALVEETTSKKRRRSQTKKKSVIEEIDIFDLLADFRPETVRDEEDFEKQLYQFLKARLGSKVKRQVPVGNQKIDIAIGDKVGIELKIAENRSKLQRLVGQVMDYVDYFDEVIAVVLDVGANVDLENYMRKLQRLGAQVLILEGSIRRKGRRREIVIRM